MLYGEGDQNKLEYGKLLAAALAYVIVHQRDSVSLGVFDSAGGFVCRPAACRGTCKPSCTPWRARSRREKTAIGPLLHELAQKIRRRGLVFLISDCFDDVDSIMGALRHLRFQGHEVTVFHVLHPDEIGFPFDGMIRFAGMEDRLELLTRPRLIRPAYIRAMKTYLQDLRRGCEMNRCDYLLMNTARPLAESLTEYLARRLRVRMTK